MTIDVTAIPTVSTFEDTVSHRPDIDADLGGAILENEADSLPERGHRRRLQRERPVHRRAALREQDAQPWRLHAGRHGRRRHVDPLDHGGPADPHDGNVHAER